MTLINDVLLNLAALISGLFLVTLTFHRVGSIDRPAALMTRYLTLVATSFFVLANTVPLAPGLLFDFRMVPVALVARRHGRLAGLAVALPVALYRFMLGGAGAVPAVTQLFLVAWFAASPGTWLNLRGGEEPPLLRRPWPALRLFALVNLPVFVSFAIAERPWLTAIETYVALTLLSTLGMLAGHIAGQARMKSLARAQHYETLASTDALTGALNRRQYDLDLKATAPGSTLLLLDLDHFKAINDTYGHDGGDRVLRAFVTLACDCVRTQDRVYRIGGEEFAVLLSDCTPHLAAEVAQRIRIQAEQRLAADADLPGAALTVSGGLAPTGPDGTSQADQRLYQAKTGGRNRIVST